MSKKNTQKYERFLKLESRLSLSILFSIYLISIFLFYQKASNALLIDDGIAGLVKFQNQGYRGFLNSFGFTSLYYFHDIFVLLVYFVMGKSSFGWFTVMITLHSINAFLNFVVFRKFYSILEIKNASLIAFIGSILFAFSPYQTENVVWAATLHYSIALTIFFLSVYLLLDNLKTGKIERKTIAVIASLFIVSLTTLEISLVFPFAYICLAVAIIWNEKTKVSFNELICRFLIPLLIIIVLYFIVTRMLKGHWIPHYGEAHLQNNTIKNYSINTARYLLKLLGFAHFTEFHSREMLYSLCEHWKRTLLAELALIFFLPVFLFLAKGERQVKTYFCLVALGFVLLLPVLHMYFMYLFNTENDRLSYFFSVVLYQLIPFVTVILSFYIGFVVSTLFAVIGLFFLQQQINKWHDAGLLQKKCIDSFVWEDAPKVYVLNSPTNYLGVYEFRNNERLPYALRFFHGLQRSEKIIQVLSSNYGSLNDSTTVSVVNDSSLLVTVNGGWLMNEFVGAVDYSNNEVSVDVLEGSPSYKVVFHHKRPGSVFIYSTGGGFKSFSGF